MSELPRRLHTIYLSEGYNAVAIITKEANVNDVPYLDKFSISLQTQVRKKKKKKKKKKKNQNLCLFNRHCFCMHPLSTLWTIKIWGRGCEIDDPPKKHKKNK